LVYPRNLGYPEAVVVRAPASHEAAAAEDGHLILVVGNDSQFAKLCEVLGCTDMAADPRFATNPQRVVNRDEWEKAFGEWKNAAGKSLKGHPWEKQPSSAIVDDLRGGKAEPQRKQRGK
jgi:hypothetical protein